MTKAHTRRYFGATKPAVASTTQTAKEAGAETAAPVDAKVEATRLKGLVGDKQVIIQREPVSNGVKLPGL